MANKKYKSCNECPESEMIWQKKPDGKLIRKLKCKRSRRMLGLYIYKVKIKSPEWCTLLVKGK